MKERYFCLVLLTLSFFMFCGCQRNNDTNHPNYETNLILEKKLTGNYGIEKSQYYPDIEAHNDQLYISFGQRFNNRCNKVVLLMDQDLNYTTGPIRLMENETTYLYSPDHEVVCGGQYFYVVAAVGEGMSDKNVLQKYDNTFHLEKSIDINKFTSREATGDQALTFYDDKLYLSTYVKNDIGTAGVNAKSLLRIYNTDLDLLKEYILEPGAKGHIAWDSNSNRWIIFASDTDDSNYVPGEGEPSSIQLYAFFYDEEFQFSHKVKLSSEAYFTDRYQVYPYGFKNTQQYYLIGYCSGHDTPKGKNHAELSVFDKNLNFITKIRITDHDTTQYTSFMIRFDTIEDRIYALYELMDMNNDKFNELYIRVFQTNFLN